MRKLIIFLLLLILSVWLGAQIVKHPGYLVLIYQPYTVQMPLWFAFLSLFAAFFLFFILIDSIDQLHFLWFKFKNWLRFRREHRSYNKTQEGLSALIEGRFKKSERLLLAGIHQTFDPLINYLGAAKAAHEQKAYDRRDHYLQNAYKVAPDADLAIGLTQAELEFNQNHLEHAAATLNHLRQLSPYHPRILFLLEKVYIRLGDFEALTLLLPSIRKAKMLTPEQILLFEKNIYSEILRNATDKRLSELHALWKSMPRSVKAEPEIVYLYVKQLKRFEPISGPEVAKEIEELTRNTLKQYYQGDLVSIYGTLPFSNLNRQLVVVGAWLKTYGPRPEILLTLGRLCERIQLWGKAKDYFEKCLALGPNPAASLEYGKLLEHLGEQDEALQKYREALVRESNIIN